MALYDQVLDLSREYFGLGAQRFLDRQIRSHLKIEPQELTPNYLEELAKWCFVSGKLILKDEPKAKIYSDQIVHLKSSSARFQMLQQERFSDVSTNEDMGTRDADGQLNKEQRRKEILEELEQLEGKWFKSDERKKLMEELKKLG